MADSYGSKTESAMDHFEENASFNEQPHLYADPTEHETIDVTKQTEKDLTQAFQHNDDLDEAQVRKLIRMIDWRVLPGLAICYAVGLIDKVNLGIVRPFLGENQW